MKKYVVIHGCVGGLLNMNDCIIAKNKKDAIRICENKGEDFGFTWVEVEKNTSNENIKRLALAEI